MPAPFAHLWHYVLQLILLTVAQDSAHDQVPGRHIMVCNVRNLMLGILAMFSSPLVAGDFLDPGYTWYCHCDS